MKPGRFHWPSLCKNFNCFIKAFFNSFYHCILLSLACLCNSLSLSLLNSSQTFTFKRESLSTFRIETLRVCIPWWLCSVAVLLDLNCLQGRPMKAAWFDALVFDPRFGGQNCLSVAQALQAKFGNLMALRQNLCVQIGVCWLQRLIELAGKELVIFKFDF